MSHFPLYRIIFSGQPLPQVTAEQLQANLAQRFKISPEKARAMMGRGDVVLKKGQPEDKAQRYLAALRQAGAVARMELEQAQVPTPQSAPTPAAAAHNPYAAPRARVADVREVQEYGELKPWNIHGRIGRLRLLAWFIVLILTFVGLMALSMGIMSILGENSTLAVILLVLSILAALYIKFCISVKRLHDIGLSAWFMLISLIPIIGILCDIALFFWPGSKDENDYGPPPPPNSTAVKILAVLFIAFFIYGITLLALDPDIKYIT